MPSSSVPSAEVPLPPEIVEDRVGFVFGRSFINPILKLKGGTQQLAAGQHHAECPDDAGCALSAFLWSRDLQ